MSDNTRLNESLSALMDDSADELELHRVLRATEEQPELRDNWRRYQLARSVMQREMPEYGVDLSASIAAMIEQEPTHGKRTVRWLKPISRAAIAASVTVAAVLGVQQFQLSGAAPELAEVQPTVQESPALRMPSGFEIPPVATRTVSTQEAQRPMVLMGQPTMDTATREELQRFLNQAMQRHIERAALGGGQSLLPYARLPQAQKEKR